MELMKHCLILEDGSDDEIFQRGGEQIPKLILSVQNSFGYSAVCTFYSFHYDNIDGESLCCIQSSTSIPYNVMVMP
jgi:hypothetical protein